MHVARAEAGLPPAEDTAAVAAPRGGGLAAAAPRAPAALPFFRAFVAIEFTLLALVAAIVDAVDGDLTARACWSSRCVPVAAITAAGHLLAILTSSRLR